MSDITARFCDKKALRRQARAVRRTLDREALGAALIARLAAMTCVQSAPSLLLFCATSDEIDLWPLTTRVPQAALYLPRMDGADEALTFHRYEPETPLIENAYGIREPSAQAPPYVPRPGDALIAPALMVDARGHRLGYGKACYDRFLAGSLAAGLTAIAAIPEALFCERLPVALAPWDYPVDWIVTEARTQRRELLTPLDARR